MSAFLKSGPRKPINQPVVASFVNKAGQTVFIQHGSISVGTPDVLGYGKTKAQGKGYLDGAPQQVIDANDHVTALGSIRELDQTYSIWTPPVSVSGLAMDDKIVGPIHVGRGRTVNFTLDATPSGAASHPHVTIYYSNEATPTAWEHFAVIDSASGTTGLTVSGLSVSGGTIVTVAENYLFRVSNVLSTVGVTLPVNLTVRVSS